MSELQLGLLAIGALVVIAVLAYNKWQELRYRRLAERSFGAGHKDVLMDPGPAEGGNEAPVPEAEEPAMNILSVPGDRLEPTMAAGAAPAAEPAQVPEEAVPMPTPAPDRTPVPAPKPPPAVLSEVIDCIVEIDCGQTAPAMQTTAVIERATSLLKNFSKPVHLESHDETHGTWTPLHHGGSCRRLRAGLQLTDRRGMASGEEIARFGRAAQQLAVELGASASFLDAALLARQSQALDSFCGEVDIQIALNVLSGVQAFNGGRLRDFAASAGFVLEGDGRFRFRDEAGRELCALANAENAAFVRGSLDNLSTTAVTFELDVPRVPGGVQAFDACAAAAQQFAAATGGQLADDNRVPLSAAGLAAIRAQLEPVYAAMEARGVPAGSPQALRLFS